MLTKLIHFTIHVSQIITLYTLNLVLCQLYLNKTERKKQQGNPHL